MAYGTAAAFPTARGIEDTYRQVLQHTETCLPCNTPEGECARGDELRAAHRDALAKARR
ncbi:hypothetical protein ABZ424_27600 [Streptomyces sp. NPDC005790]|uniref:hypothetical protein n=1 Tax=Streptomyces sp. NPDC005790 TaxID=3154777 RepID=UPI0033FAAD88